MATLSLAAVRSIARRRRPWTMRLECVDRKTNTDKYWYATGRAMDEKVEIGWGRKGAKPQHALVDFTEFEARVPKKLAKGYEYVDTKYIRMTPANLALLGGVTPSSSPTGSGAPLPNLPPAPIPSGPITATVIKKRDPVQVNPSLPAPFGFIRWLKPTKGGGWEALDTNKAKLLDLPLGSGKTMLRDFPTTIEILA